MAERAPSHRYHPWHGVSLGENAPDIVNCYIEIVPTDTIKYELDKESGLLKVDRPQKFSSLCPTLYGFIPRTYAGKRVAAYCMEKSGMVDIRGDGDPIDICVFTEKVVPRGDIILRAYPIGGFRMIDNGEADDKLIAVLYDDFVYGSMRDLEELHTTLIERLRHYFLTYKCYPNLLDSKVKIVATFNAQEAKEIITTGALDYQEKFSLTAGYDG